jgi:hypothetical protein
MPAKQSSRVALIEEGKLHPKRSEFKKNILKNPNYYGNFPGLGNIVDPIQGDTFFEQLSCLGLNPGTTDGSLEAIIQINQAIGYNSDPCGTGSTEWVRFYVQDGAGWTDVGVTGVTVYNLAGSNFPVSYGVSVDLSQVQKFCWVENVLNVRAILSWELAPPANQPDFIPVWGNVVDARVQIAPAPFFFTPIASLVESDLVKFDSVLAAAIDLTKPLPIKSSQPLSYAALKQLYATGGVPAHRYGFSAAKQIEAKPLSDTIALASANAAVASPGILSGADLGAILAALEGAGGDTTFEQLTCAGYNPQTRTLEAVVQINANSGYSGGLCTVGSYEYVGFYAFFGGAWQSLGLAQVNVHDLQSVTSGNPISYAVFRVSNVVSELCEGLKAIPLRAILSWQEPPTGPDFIPVWGNVVDTQIQPQIGVDFQGARILRIGDVGVFGIQASANVDLIGDYLANPTGVAEDCNNAYDSPFGGSIGIEADFNPKPVGTFDPVTGALLPGAHPVIYQVFITPQGGIPFQLLNNFSIGVFPIDAPIANPEVVISQTPQTAPGPVNGGVAGAVYYTYYESSDGQIVNPRVAAWFEAGGLAQGNYAVEIDAYAWDGSTYQPLASVQKTFYVYNGYAANKGLPLVTLTPPASADCGNVPVGTKIVGTYSVADDFFGEVYIEMTPISYQGQPVTLPPVILSNTNNGLSSVIYDGTNTNGVSGTFSIDTTGLPPCGYTVQLNAWDRALVNTTCDPHGPSETGFGFCLVAQASN